MRVKIPTGRGDLSGIVKHRILQVLVKNDPCKNGWTNRDTIWGGHSCGSQWSVRDATDHRQLCLSWHPTRWTTLDTGCNLSQLQYVIRITHNQHQCWANYTTTSTFSMNSIHHCKPIHPLQQIRHNLKTYQTSPTSLPSGLRPPG